MGLTIHYTLRWTPPNPPPNDVSARRFVEEARRQIVRARLGRVTALRPADGGPFGGQQFLQLHENKDFWFEVEPEHGYLFTLDVGADCEPLRLGLCRYPRLHFYKGHPLFTNLPGWRLSSFSKTQYASLHGWEHFRRCHLAVIAALEIWRERGARVKISDEGDYWPRRSERNLRRELDQMNGIVAGLAGALKDAAEDDGGPPVQSPIFAHPQFERLEAEGVERVGGHVAQVIKTLRRR